VFPSSFSVRGKTRSALFLDEEFHLIEIELVADVEFIKDPHFLVERIGLVQVDKDSPVSSRISSKAIL